MASAASHPPASSSSSSHHHHHGKKWQSEHVVPQLIHDIPPHILSVHFDSGKKAEEGNELTPTEVKHAPIIQWPIEEGSNYTLMMIDPDAPHRDDPKFRYWLHWLVCNITNHNDLSKGSTILSHYVPSAPPAGSLHRYLLLIYKQSSSYDLSHEKKSFESGADRKKFDPQHFLSKYDKSAVLVSGNFFQAKYDSYCDTVWKSLK